MAQTMKAVIIRTPGGPEVLKVESIPIPTPQPGQCLIRIRAFGLNRSEMFTRQGHSGKAVEFPRVLGIECVGTVESCPGNEFAAGTVVASVMGGIGRTFDGGYAEFTCPPANQVREIKSDLSWEVLGAMPEMFQTAWGSLFRTLRLKKDDHLLVRGGTSSVGLAAAGIAKVHGAHVTATSRSDARFDLMQSAGADECVVDDGKLAEKYAGKFDKVLELVGVTTLGDSLKCTKEGGVVCSAGIVGNKWVLDKFSPGELIPTGVYLSFYGGGVPDFFKTPMDELAQQVKDRKLKLKIGKVFTGLETIVDAHKLMDSNQAGGKIVVLVP